MKSVRITFKNGTGKELTVIGKGNSKQSTSKIVERVKQNILKYFDLNADTKNIHVKNYQHLKRSGTVNSESDLITIQVNRHIEENFCRRYYGSQYDHKNHPKAEGQVGPTRLS